MYHVPPLDDENPVSPGMQFNGDAIGEGVNGAVAAGAQLVNLSLGRLGFGGASESAATYNAWVQDISVVASKGNDTSSSFHSPSDWDWVIGIGAITQFGAITVFSNSGGGIRVAATGSSLPTTKDGGGITSFTGTSAAAPVATGVLSLIRAANPDLWADEAEEILNLTAREAGAPGYDIVYGYGRIDAAAAVEFATSHDFQRLGGPHTSLVEVQGSHSRTFVHTVAGNLPSATYFATRYSARRWIDYSQYNLLEIPDILIRFRDVEGWNNASPNHETQWAGVMPGTITTDGVWVETFTYKLFNQSGQFAGWWPCPTGNCSSAPVTDLQVTIAMPPVSCCIIRGDVNHDSIGPDIDDLNFLVDHLFINFPPIPCVEEGNIDNDPNGVVDVADLSLLIDHLFINFPPLDVCD